MAIVMLVSGGAATARDVTTMRVPDGGIQPQIVVDHDGVVHMIYCKGDPRGGDVFYVRSSDGGESFSDPVRVNRRDGVAVTAGTIRGPHMAIGRNGRVHVAWNASVAAAPGGDHHTAPLFYTRMNDTGDGFEPERNVIEARYGLDGGSSIAADDAGNVYVIWHAPMEDGWLESDRRVWIARSRDDGATFSTERMTNDAPLGACGCCGLRAFAARDGDVHVLFRSAWEGVNRHMYLLRSSDQGERFEETLVDEWTVGQCVMSSASFVQSVEDDVEETPRVYLAWETKQQVHFAWLDRASGVMSRPVPAPGRGENRKHPVLATNGSGRLILAWSEGSGWQRGGWVAWQVFDRDGEPITGQRGRIDGHPTWSFPAVFARPDGTFVIVH